MKVLLQTETSLLGYSYRVTEEKESKKPFAVECQLNSELYQITYFKKKKQAVEFFNQSRIKLKVIKG